MASFSLMLPPPQNWQDFEKLLKGVIEVVWPQQGWHVSGRPGQAQLGIDIYGYDKNGDFTGIQCKKKNGTNPNGTLLTHSLLSKTNITTEIKEAEKITNPSIRRFIFATTSARDTNIQDVIRNINEERIKKKKFSVDIWFWEDVLHMIENHGELVYMYYSEFLRNINQYDKDMHILSLLRRAFMRPAFSREIRGEESGGDFIDAITNTQQAITTGRLYNRQGDLIASSFDYSVLSEQSWRQGFENINHLLDQLRSVYAKGLKENKVTQHPGCLDVRDHELAEQLNLFRVDSLLILNNILVEKGLEPIENELTQDAAHIRNRRGHY